MHNKAQKNLIILFVTVLFFSVNSFTYANTSELIFTAPAIPIGVGDEFSMPLYLNSAGQRINTIAADILFSDSTVRLTHVSTANSIITSWIDQPILSGNSVTFSGIIAGGFDSVVDPVTNEHTNGVVATLYFTAIHPGTASFTYADSHAYLNDGLGTEATLASIPLSFAIEKTGSGIKNDITDTTPPEAFTPIVASTPDLYNGAYTLFFQTTDKGSGMDHYEVSEGYGQWKRATSPYEIVDQTLRSPLRVKAFDAAGNYRIETVSGSGTFTRSLALIPVALIVILLAWIFLVYKKKMKKYRSKHE